MSCFQNFAADAAKKKSKNRYDPFSRERAAVKLVAASENGKQTGALRGVCMLARGAGVYRWDDTSPAAADTGRGHATVDESTARDRLATNAK